jgi:hypothetical protein
MAQAAASAAGINLKAAAPAVGLGVNMAIGIVSLIFIIAGLAEIKHNKLTAIALFGVAFAIFSWGQSISKQAVSTAQMALAH